MSQQGSPGRYQRSFSGLVVAMAVTVAAVLAFAGLQSLAREAPTAGPRPVDYTEHVRALQEQGVRVPYPASLPAGWFVHEVDYRPGPRGRWALTLLTDEKRYIGVVLEAGKPKELVRKYLGDEAQQGGPVRIPGPPAIRWRSFHDAGGDVGYTPIPRRFGSRMLLVHGSAPPAAVRELASRLTTKPVEDTSAKGRDGGSPGTGTPKPQG